MTGMPADIRVLRRDVVPDRRRTAHPEPYAAARRDRYRRAFGDRLRLSDIRVHLARLEPGAATSQRPWHMREGELVMVLENEAGRVCDESETAMPAGRGIGFLREGVANAHRLVHRGEVAALVREVATRRPDIDEVPYPDIGLRCRPGRRFVPRDGTPWERP
ncbi:hypothetical protein HRbin40_00864 [bacterium HR40]|nr:hypothetical protein HRbin40_00864 [bacterium HR40]